ncbi:hypothetical protein B7L17_019825 [Burkholderia cenocepacia]|uniref:hypothetical protein n=1 Tax=Burkholderia cenocepacia TaxID=95486 RepID=UPI002238121F|nr:hypothetical protein [Burkholderia cenocepacia]MCW5119987.1 hypothetical protein [Burkholderia cenocepacia]MCW5132520.1 hypothetical protein [Burkholderia cenocepacia]MCW5175184.1 hypothetical protein [Burkholderia cenocepacia]
MTESSVRFETALEILNSMIGFVVGEIALEEEKRQPDRVTLGRLHIKRQLLAFERRTLDACDDVAIERVCRDYGSYLKRLRGGKTLVNESLADRTPKGEN